MMSDEAEPEPQTCLRLNNLRYHPTGARGAGSDAVLGVVASISDLATDNPVFQPRDPTLLAMRTSVR